MHFVIDAILLLYGYINIVYGAHVVYHSMLPQISDKVPQSGDENKLEIRKCKEIYNGSFGYFDKHLAMFGYFFLTDIRRVLGS